MPAQLEGPVLPALPVHALNHMHSDTPLPAVQTTDEPFSPEIPRSASYTFIPASEKEPVITSIKRTFSENVLSIPSEAKTKMNDSVHTTNMVLFRRASKKAKRRITSGIFSFGQDDDDEAQTRDTAEVEHGKVEQSKSLTRSVTGTIRTLARKSWAGSRSSSPASNEGPISDRTQSRSPSKDKTTSQTESNDSRSSSRSPQRPHDASVKQNQRPVSLLLSKTKSETSLKRLSRSSSSTSLASVDRKMSLGQIPPLPTSLSSDKLAAVQGNTVRRKDPLGAAFREIDGEYVAFQARTSMQKSKVLRHKLIPFLQENARHLSNTGLRAEDLDRRVMALNRWWTGLLEVLHGTNNAISPADKPVFFEATSLIMSRPEWKVPGFPATPGENSSPNSIPKSKSTNSLESDASDFLVDSVYQNVRNIYVQNLLSQMAFVVEKLSWRPAPSSLVTFAGKTCAYAFFFCPGVADLLARQWSLPAGTLSRVFKEFDIRLADKLDLVCNTVASNFPPPARSLAITSPATLSRHLSPRLHTPPGSEKVDWWQPTWVNRWCGRDTDLFFTFCKFYHALICDFLPREIAPKERVGVPGLIPVCAQMLVVLEATVYRQANKRYEDQEEADGLRFDRDHPDALASLPMTIANADRHIAENRLIILLRDVLGDVDPEFTPFRNLLRGSFDAVVKASVSKISMYNTDPCFVICDFMEEVLPITFRYQQTYNEAPILNWPFWLQVFKKMMQTQTTLTRIRLIAFLYDKWTILIHNEERKRELVLEWLLDPQVFESNFCNWSPMVRHYFYRLFCWRVARYHGQATDLDVEILQTLVARLNRCWAQYQYLLAEAEMRGLSLPSSAPCTPAPSRSLVIIRIDNGQPLYTPSKTPFDKPISSNLINQSSPYQSHSSALNSIPTADVPAEGAKKRWSLFRGLTGLGFAPGNHRPGEVTPPGSPDENGATAYIEQVPGPNSAIAAPRPVPRPITPPHQACSFRFELQLYHAHPHAERNRVLAAPQLPHGAQNLLRARESSETNSSSSSASSGCG